MPLPNILYVHSHDTGRYVQPYGYGIPTPRIQGLAEERFMINTHPWVLEKFAVKARDYDEYVRMLQSGYANELARTAAAA